MIETPLSVRQLAGLEEDHLIELADGQRLCPQAAVAFAELQRDAGEAGFELAIASSYRSFARQLAIFNAKASGQRPVHDDAGRSVDMARLPPADQLQAILRFSALPGTSRHHWGTDLDVFDAAALADDARVQLTPDEVAPGGVFDALHCWLDGRMAAGQSHGFYRPYGEDRGGVAVERWHLSYAPLAVGCASGMSAQVLRERWQEALGGSELLLQDEIEGSLAALLHRYVEVPEGWCPAP